MLSYFQEPKIRRLPLKTPTTGNSYCHPSGEVHGFVVSTPALRNSAVFRVSMLSPLVNAAAASIATGRWSSSASLRRRLLSIINGHDWALGLGRIISNTTLVSNSHLIGDVKSHLRRNRTLAYSRSALTVNTQSRVPSRNIEQTPPTVSDGTRLFFVFHVLDDERALP